MIKSLERDPIRYEEYWVLRGIHDDGLKKTVVKEEYFKEKPGEPEIVEFLIDNKEISFVSVEHNFRLIREVNPFE